METTLALLLAVPIILLRGWILLLLWSWFIIPLGAPEITLAHAIGLGIIISYSTGSKYDLREKTTEEKIKEFVYLVFAPLFALLIGRITQAFM